ncbi:MJ1477/TM1410 family putative glycoside hydrolase [Rubellimicrobium roseum]|uniref:Uncharacterized protein n=1 Tax=Rubellimicrobium roseum TaxID=687525 RepID=A0A5C4NLJ2_9RHOB|nr:MJ1477/TM1410 family putative glycoside hydrolase [Rubellimicrobium roseum]TNC74982.1 hypothetical protein FHG71_02340 [Rubellimicrobium roseum]
MRLASDRTEDDDRTAEIDGRRSVVTFQTSTGPVAVDDWGYVLQGRNGSPLRSDRLASAVHDLLVIDASRDGTDAGRFRDDEIVRMKDGLGGRAVVASYISIGEASDYRDYWRDGWTDTGTASGRRTDQAPEWLGPVNPDWPESRKVRYWNERWQDIIFNDRHTGEIDAIVRAGFDAAYLDIVDAYYFWAEEVPDRERRAGDPADARQAARRMVDFIVDLTAHARETNPDFFVIPQNGAWILDDLGSDATRRKAYLDAIGGIAVEDVYFGGNADENNPLDPDEATIAVLKRDFLSHGKPVFAVDYVNGGARVSEFIRQAREDGFIPYAAPRRDLDRLAGPHDGGSPYVIPTDGDDVLRGSMRADRIEGLGGRDRIDGRGGPDILYGGTGADRLSGGRGADTIGGGGGSDHLSGGPGADRFVFRSARDSGPSHSARDTIHDFSPSSGDRIDLRGIDADSGRSGNQGFDFVGTDPFSGRASELRCVRTATDTWLRGDTNGDGRPDFIVHLDDPIWIGANHILL